jgi:non-specific serine/threonine protein kinase
MTFAAQALSLYRELGNEQILPWAMQRLGIETLIVGDHARAAALFSEALERFRALGSDLGTIYALTNLGFARHALGDKRQAAALYRESLARRSVLSDPWETAELFEQIAALAVDAGALVPAARLLGAARGLYQISGTEAQPYIQKVGDRAQTAAGARLGPGAFAAAYEAGQGLSFIQAIQEGLETVDAIAATLSSPKSMRAATASGLTPREREVLRLLADGDSDRQIAAALSISPKTAGNHVSRILAKLGVTTRTAAATHAVRHGLA